MGTDERSAIEAVVMTYLDGLHEGDADKLASVFHTTSALTWEESGVVREAEMGDPTALLHRLSLPAEGGGHVADRAEGLRQRAACVTVRVLR